MKITIEDLNEALEADYELWCTHKQAFMRLFPDGMPGLNAETLSALRNAGIEPEYLEELIPKDRREAYDKSRRAAWALYAKAIDVALIEAFKDEETSASNLVIPALIHQKNDNARRN